MAKFGKPKAGMLHVFVRDGYWDCLLDSAVAKAVSFVLAVSFVSCEGVDWEKSDADLMTGSYRV